MKSQLVIFVLVGFVAFAHCFPGVPRDHEDSDESDNPNVDTLLVIPDGDSIFNRREMDLDDMDDMNDGFFNPFRFNIRPISNPFSGIWENLQNTMNRLRDQISRLPSPTYPFSGKLPEGANTTSTTKIIDGHVVTINETTYNDSDSDSGFIFKIRTVDIKPENSTNILTGLNDDDTNNNGGGENVDKEPASTSASNLNDKSTERSVETVEDPGNNEIPDKQVEILNA